MVAVMVAHSAARRVEKLATTMAGAKDFEMAVQRAVKKEA